MNAVLADNLTSNLVNDVQAFSPQLAICAGIVLMLLIRLVPRYDRWHLGWIALALSIGACVLSCNFWYVHAGFLKGRRQSSEAALKYVVYGGGASGVMLYGISLLAGKFDTGYLPTIVRELGATGQLSDPVVVMGVSFLLLGVGFKLASVPF